MLDDILTTSSVAVVTGGAAGIGLAAAMRFAERGLAVCIADVNEDALASAATGSLASRRRVRGRS